MVKFPKKFLSVFMRTLEIYSRILLEKSKTEYPKYFGVAKTSEAISTAEILKGFWSQNPYLGLCYYPTLKDKYPPTP